MARTAPVHRARSGAPQPRPTRSRLTGDLALRPAGFVAAQPKLDTRPHGVSIRAPNPPDAPVHPGASGTLDILTTCPALQKPEFPR
jgi:hypothetical protein